MALLRNCIWASVKPKFASLCVITTSGSSSLNQRRGFLNILARCHFVTNLERRSTSLINHSSRGGSRKEEGKQKNSHSHFSIMLIPAVFSGFFTNEAVEKSTPEEDLVNHIKRSILLIQNGESEKAERLLHIALKMAQDLKHEKGITYVYDTMANLAFDNGEYAKAQKLFVEVLRRLIGSGLSHDDIIVVNISLKVADAFVALSDYEKGEQGFLFCLDTLRKKITAGASDEDTLVLYSQTLDRYALFLLHAGRVNEAVKNIETALEVAESVFQDLNNKVGAILLSDLAAIKMAAGDKEVAEQCFDRAQEIANQKEVDTSVAVIMVNRGLALKDKGMLKEAHHWCEMGLQHALKEKSKGIVKAAEECLKANSKDEKPPGSYSKI